MSTTSVRNTAPALDTLAIQASNGTSYVIDSVQFVLQGVGLFLMHRLMVETGCFPSATHVTIASHGL
jgi:hypothetical protein